MPRASDTDSRFLLLHDALASNAREGADGGGTLAAKEEAQQAAVAEMDEFKGSVVLVPTDVFWDMKAQSILDRKAELGDRFKQEASKWSADGGYHYLGSPYFHCKAGRAFGDAMLSLMPPKSRF